MIDMVWCLPAVETFGRLIADALSKPLFVDAVIGDCDTVYIVGMYDGPTYKRTLECTKRAKHRVIHWCGNDARLSQGEYLPDATHLVTNNELLPFLAAHGITARTVHFPTPNHPPVTPLPEVPTLAFYGGSNPGAYGGEIVQFLSECFPEARLITYGFGEIDDYDELTAQTTVCLQPAVLHGGLTVREAAEAGRCAISTYDLPYIDKFNPADLQSLVRKVRKGLAMKEPNIVGAAYWKRANSPELFAKTVAEVLS